MKRNHALHILFCSAPLLLALIGSSLHAAELVDDNATLKTYALQEALLAQMGKGIMFGHHHTTAYGTTWEGDSNRSDVKDATGSFPAVYSWGFWHTGVAYKGDSEYAYLRQLIVEAHARGGINMMGWHIENAYTGSDAWGGTEKIIPPGSIAAMLPNGAANAEFLAKLDAFADFVLSLQDEHGDLIPLIFRPFHEMNGDWFWWGVDGGTNTEFIELWQYTVDYLRIAKHVHNLLYAYSPDNCYGSQSVYLSRYPGDDYVDILGKDHYYSGDTSHRYWLSVETMTTELDLTVSLADERGKVAALTEFGYRNEDNFGLGFADDPNWFMYKFLVPVMNSGTAKRIAFASAWRNANENEQQTDPRHYFVPYSGQQNNENDFINFYENPMTVFGNDLEESPMYGIVIHVDQAATGIADGSSWDHAFITLEDAVGAAWSGDEIWVSGGTYETSSLSVNKALTILGGFHGGETTREQRDWTLHETTLAGNGAGTILLIDHPTVTIDGFKLSGGLAGNGGAIKCNKTSIISHCIFKFNTAEFAGGAIHVSSAGNSTIIENCLFADNSAETGAAIHNDADTYTTIVNCTISYNETSRGATITSHYGTQIVSSIIWDNIGTDISGTGTISYSCIMGYGGTNIGTNPYFVDPESGDYRLMLGSPAVDSGLADFSPSDDLAGLLRHDGLPDMGAFEGAIDTNVAPIAVATADSPIGVGDVATLSSSGSFDPDEWPNDRLSYKWEVISPPEGSGFMTALTDDWSEVSFSPRQEGSYIFELSVSDGGLTSTVEVQVNVGHLVLEIKGTVTEGDGLLIGTVRLPADLVPDAPVVVTLGSDNMDKLTVPDEVIIPANQNSGEFTVTILDNLIDDEDTEVTILAFTNDWLGSGRTILVQNDDVLPLIEVTGNTNLVSAGVGSPVTELFTVSNKGSVDLILTNTPAVVVTGTNADEFVVTTAPETTIAPGAPAKTFVLTFTPTEGTTRTADITIISNDPVNSPLTFTVTGEIVVPKKKRKRGCAMTTEGSYIIPLLLLLTVLGFRRSILSKE